jgi:dipeptide/tripeptide permease
MNGVILGIVLLIVLIFFVIIWFLVSHSNFSKTVKRSKMSKEKKTLIMSVPIVVIVSLLLLSRGIFFSGILNRISLYLLVLPITLLLIYLIDKNILFAGIGNKKERQKMFIKMIVLMSIFFIIGVGLLSWALLNH